MEQENSNLRFVLGITTGLLAVFGTVLFFSSRPIEAHASAPKASRPTPYMKQGNLLILLGRDNG